MPKNRDVIPAGNQDQKSQPQDTWDASCTPTAFGMGDDVPDQDGFPDQDVERIEKLSSDEIARRLGCLGLAGQIRPALWRSIAKFRQTPADEIIRAQAEEERREIAQIDVAPITEVHAELDRLGVNRRKDVATILRAAASRTEVSGRPEVFSLAEVPSLSVGAASRLPLLAKLSSRRWRRGEYAAMAATVASVLTVVGLMLPPRSYDDSDTATGKIAADATSQTSVHAEKNFYRLKNSPVGDPSRADEGHRLTAAPAASELLNAEPGRNDPLSARGMGAAHNFSKAQNSLVRILVRLDKLSRAGTGFVISGRRFIATSNHVIENGKNFDLGFLDHKGRARWIHAELRATDPAKDLAILEAGEDVEGLALVLGDYEPEWAGDVYAMGFPVAADEGVIDASSFSSVGSSFLRPSVVKGIVSRVLDNPTITARMQHQAPISPGYSGGPLMDRCGAVVGVSNSHHKTDTGLSYAVLGSDLADLARKHRIPVTVATPCGQPIVEASHSDRTPSPGSVASQSDPAAPPSKPPIAADPYETEMFRQAASCIERADIAAARLFLQHLAARGNARGMLGLALTYDPNFLDRIQVVGLQPDVERARDWYLRALEGGAGEARWRLEQLPPANAGPRVNSGDNP